MKLFKILLYPILFVVLCLAFLPKQNLYFLGEKELKKYDIIISDEKFTPSLFGFKITNASIYIQGVNIAKIDNLTLSFNGLKILSKEIGRANGNIDISTQSAIIEFKPTKIFIQKYGKMTLKYFKKQENGVYKYEYKLF